MSILPHRAEVLRCGSMDKRTEMRLAAARKEAKRQAYAKRHATKLQCHERDGIGEILRRLAGPQAPHAAANPERPSKTRPETTRAWTPSDPRDYVPKRVLWNTKTELRLGAGVAPKRPKRPAPVTRTGATGHKPDTVKPDAVKLPAPIVPPVPRWVTVSEKPPEPALTPAARRLVALRDLAVKRF